MGAGTVVAISPTVAAAPLSARGCHQRTLILSAMPVELSPLLGKLQHQRTVTIDSHDFFVGDLRGHRAVLALTGIGPVNARRTTHQALSHFRCGRRKGIDAVVFAGVAGGDEIGNVTVPRRWTQDDGKRFFPANRSMLEAARRVSHRHIALEQKTPVGDPLCTCGNATTGIDTVTVTHRPKIEVGGAGQTTDPFSGHRLPCVPAGGDVFGCDPCPAHKKVAAEAINSLPGFMAVADPDFFAGYLSTSESGKYVAEDEETAAVAAIAHHHHLPFIGFRAVSDGGGDPLHLPGFPFEFFLYRQLAADNAALATFAFLSAWHDH
jgi:nucleoside phosphorylase